MRLPITALLTALLTAALSSSAAASLVDRGNGMVYDTVLNVTWLSDANYAKTSGESATGLFTRSQSKTWAENLDYGGFTDWRLATVSPIGDEWKASLLPAYNGSSEHGYNITDIGSELAYMFYVNLGLKAAWDTNGASQSHVNGIFGDGIERPGQTRTIGLITITEGAYWTQTPFPSNGTIRSFGLNTMTGLQGIINHDNGRALAWAVRDGDVAAAQVSPVPLPGAAWLMLSGLGVLGAAVRRRRTNA